MLMLERGALERRPVRSFAQMQKCGRLVHVRSNATEVRSTAELHCVSVRYFAARTQAREGRSQLRERAGIGNSAFDRKNCVQPHCRCLIFQIHKQKAKND
jgi:hypothetical protein